MTFYVIYVRKLIWSINDEMAAKDIPVLPLVASITGIFSFKLLFLIALFNI